MAGRAVGRARRARTLERVGELGVDAAAAEAGVTVATLKRWQRAAMSADAEHQEASADNTPSRGNYQESAEDGGGTPENCFSSASQKAVDADPIGAMRQRAREARAVADLAVGKAKELLAAGKGTEARNCTVSYGISLDKAERLDLAVLEAEGNAVRVAGAQARVIAEVLRATFDAAGVPWRGDGVRRTIRTLLGQATRGEALVVSPADAELARAEVREVIARELRAEIEAEAGVPDRPALPAPEPEPVAEPAPKPEPEPEPVVAEPESVAVETVGEEQVPRGFLEGKPARLRAAEWERHKMLDRMRREREEEQPIPFGTSYAPSRFRGVHDVPGHLLGGPGGGR